MPGPSRRAVLTAPWAALLVGCTGGADGGGNGRADEDVAPRAEPAPVDPDDAPRAAAADRERALLRAYDAALLAVPSLQPRLLPLRTHHVEHLTALLRPVPSPSGSAGASTSPSGGTSAGASPAPAVPTPADASAALAGLVAAEREAGAAHAQACLTVSRALAGVLASLSASELSHPVALV